MQAEPILSLKPASDQPSLVRPAVPTLAHVEHLELTMSHLGLGSLNEYALMVLFGNAHSHRLVAGTAVKPDGIIDQRGHMLYPAYFMTRLRVPPCNLLNTFGLWSDVDVGVDVHRFGDTLLASRYILGRAGTVGSNSDEWDTSTCPSMEGNNLIVVDAVEGGGTAHREVAVPLPDRIAALPKRKTVPEGVSLSRKARSEALDSGMRVPMLRTREPIRYAVRPGMDAAPGHAMIFAKFGEIMDFAEHHFLHHDPQVGLPAEVLGYLQVVERDTYYYGNCFGGEALTIHLAGHLELLDCHAVDEESNCILAAELNLSFEICRAGDKSLLCVARVKKLLAIPLKDQDLVRDVTRIVARL